MTRIRFDDQSFEMEPNETVLDTLLRNNQQVPHRCRAGICQSCLMRCLDEIPVPATSQTGLKDSLQKQNYFLPCICTPEHTMSMRLPNTENVWLEVEVVDKYPLSQNVILLKLQLKEPLDFFAGQFVNLRNKSGVIRSYSIATIPNDEHTLVFHIRVLPHGQFSRWVADELNIGMSLHISSAQGDCHYKEGNPNQPLLLIGTGTGLAPLYGIILDALDNYHHSGDIHLFHGSRDVLGLYFENKLHELAQAHTNFYYTPCISGENSDPSKYAQGRANQIALAKFNRLQGWRVYLCGQPDMVLQTKKMAYLQGASLKEIDADAFLS